MTYGVVKKNFNGKNNNLSKEEYLAKKKEKMERQTRNLDMIENVAEYLDNLLKNKSDSRVRVRDLIDYLQTKGYNTDETKDISQTNYIMVELANAQKNDRISGDRTNIRVLYLEERLKTSYMKELHERVDSIIKTYDSLFKWDTKATGEEYNVEFVSK